MRQRKKKKGNLLEQQSHTAQQHAGLTALASASPREAAAALVSQTPMMQHRFLEDSGYILAVDLREMKLQEVVAELS